MLIGEAKIEDLAGILRLYAQLNPEDPVVEDGRDREALNDIVESNWLYLFVGRHAGQIVATCYLNVVPNLSRNVSPYGIIENVIVDRELHNRGLGKQIMRHALDRAWERGCYKVMLQTGSRRESTHNFYKRCGFLADDKFAFVARRE